jgi:hypothetical protein
MATYGGVALLPCPSALEHSLREPSEVEPRPASLEGAA